LTGLPWTRLDVWSILGQALAAGCSVDILFRVFELLGRIPGWVWTVLTVLFVGYQIDRRLEYIWKVIYEMPERWENARRLQGAGDETDAATAVAPEDAIPVP
jgi:hypothetical protein